MTSGGSTFHSGTHGGPGAVRDYVSRYDPVANSDGVLRMILTGVAALMMVFGPFAAPPAWSADRPVRIVALGDSLTAGYGLPATAAFPVRLEAALRARGHSIVIVNAGVSGDTMQGGLDRLDWSIPDGTDGVIVELGANDALRGLDPAQTRRALAAIIARLKQRNIAVMLAGMRAPPNLGPDYAARFDPIFSDLAQQHDLVLYPFFLEGVAAQRELNQNDGLHPTAEGINVIVERILPSVERFIARLRERS